MKTLAERFSSKVGAPDSNGCEPWLGATTGAGYGHMNLGGRKDGQTTAHRVAYTLDKGPIPSGYVVDHLCRNPGCVNPDHLEAVPQTVNVMRGLIGEQQRTGRCKRGHDLGTEGYWRSPLHVRCRACKREDRAAAKLAAKAAA